MNGESLPPPVPGPGQSAPGVPSGPPQIPEPMTVSKGMATTSLVLGILSLVCFGIITGIPAIIFGHIAHGRARKLPQQFGGAGLAIAGFVLGYTSILATLVFAALLLPALSQAKNKAQSINCVNNLKQIGLAARMWAMDNNDQFPFNVSTTNGGTMELCRRGADGYDANAYLHFEVMSNELNTPKILVCVADSSKTAAADFQSLQATNVTYLMRTGTNVSEVFPEEALARCPIHGNILRCDGSVDRGRTK
jgi:hypothetical protein